MSTGSASAAAAPASAMAAPSLSVSSSALQCTPYNPQKESWSLFMDKFEFYLLGSKQTNCTDQEKQGIFLNVCGPDVLQMASALASPLTLWEITWTELKRRLQAHYAPTPSSLSRRAKFYKREQAEGESVADYLASLRVLATGCKFDTQLEWMIRDRLILGLRDEKLKRRLTAKHSFSLAAAIEEVLAAEEVRPQTKKIQPENVMHASSWNPPSEEEDDTLDGDIHQVRTMRGPKMAHRPRQAQCAGCNGSHARANCPFLHAVCNYCSKKGHISRACRANQPQPGIPTRGGRGAPFRRTPPNSRWENENPKRPSEGCLTIYEDIQQTSMNGTEAEEFSTVVTVGGSPCSFQVDSGSPVTIMQWKKLKELIPSLQKNDLSQMKTILRDCQGKHIPVLGQVDVLANHKGTSTYAPIAVTEQAIPVLLGRVWIRRLKITLDDQPSVNSTTARPKPEGDITEEFADVFNGELGKYTGTPISLNLDPTTTPIRLKPRRVPLALKHKVDEQLDKLITQGILVPVDHARWETPIVTPIKPDGSVRVCADYKCTLNKALQGNPYPVPVIHHLLHSLGRGKIFAKLDLAQAYQQLPVDEETAEAQTIVTHRGAFKCTRLQFGISTAPGIFQSLMERLLQGIPGVTPYFDDVLVAAENRRDLTNKLKKTLQKFRDAGLKLNKQKCLIGVSEVEFLGFKIDAAGIHPTRNKTAAIHNAPAPSNKTELQAFLGLLNFYSIFLKQKATIAEPLHKLLSKDTPWHWGGAEQKAFQAIKTLLTSDSVLVQYCETTPLQLTCDASPYGVGAVLSHIFPNGQTAPIAFYSRTLSAPERNYSQLDKEALAAIAGIKRFHDYLYGRKFTLVTDHKPLLGIIAGDKQTPQILSPRMTRWIEFLTAYSYTLQYQPGAQIAHADALSRCPIPETMIDPAPSTHLLLIEHIQDNPVTAELIAQHSEKDPITSTVLQWVLNGWPHRKRGDVYRPFENRQTELSTHRGCLMWGHRVVIPASLRERILTSIHEGHLGIVRMKSLARGYVWWPGLDKDIEDKAKFCDPCQSSHAAPPGAAPSKWETTKNPWSRIHIDFAGPVQNQMLLIVVDSHSNWTEVIPMRSATTEATINALQRLFATHGLPDVMVSDNGPQFTAMEFKDFLTQLGIRHATSAPFRPMANGKAERAVRTTKEAISRMHSGNLHQKINTFLLAQHSTPSTTTHRSPAELLMGRKIKIPLSRVHPDATDSHPTVLFPGVRSFSEGEGVFARNYAGKPKWVPGTIIRLTGPKSYELRLSDGRTWKRHIDQLRERPIKGDNPNKGGELHAPNTDRDAQNLPGGQHWHPPAAETRQPQFPSSPPSPLPAPPPPSPPQPPPPPQTPPRTQEGSGTSYLGSSSGSNERSLRRSTRPRLRPTYLKDYACAVRTLEVSEAGGEGCNVLRRRERSLHSGPPA